MECTGTGVLHIVSSISHPHPLESAVSVFPKKNETLNIMKINFVCDFFLMLNMSQCIAVGFPLLRLVSPAVIV